MNEDSDMNNVSLYSVHASLELTFGLKARVSISMPTSQMARV